MARKVNRLLNHQTKLSQTHKHLFPISLQEIKFKSKAIIKGCLFFPWEEWILMTKRNETNEGWWMSIDQIANLNSQGAEFGLITQKINWIFPYSKQQELISFEKLMEFAGSHLKQANEIMVVCYDAMANPIDRGFVMKQNWPN